MINHNKDPYWTTSISFKARPFFFRGSFVWWMMVGMSLRNNNRGVERNCGNSFLVKDGKLLIHYGDKSCSLMCYCLVHKFEHVSSSKAEGIATPKKRCNVCNAHYCIEKKLRKGWVLRTLLVDVNLFKVMAVVCWSIALMRPMSVFAYWNLVVLQQVDGVFFETWLSVKRFNNPFSSQPGNTKNVPSPPQKKKGCSVLSRKFKGRPVFLVASKLRANVESTSVAAKITSKATGTPFECLSLQVAES